MINYSQKVNERLIGQSIINEPHIVGIIGVAVSSPGLVRLVEVPQAPSPFSTVSITGSGGPYNEIPSGSPTGGQFLVDYTTGGITFAATQNGNTVLVSYIGLGSEIAAEDINELQEPVGIALNLDGSLTSHIVKPASISNSVSDDFSFPHNVTVSNSLIVSSATASTVPYFDASKILVSSVVSPTELGYVSGVTSAIQTQLNSKQSTLTTGNLTDVGTDGITVTGGTGSVIGSGTSISQHVADSTHNGYLSDTDWSTFNSKQNALVFPLSISQGGTNSSTALVNGKIMASSSGSVVESSISTANVFLADGTVLATGALDLNNHLIHNVLTPVSFQDAATKGYVDTSLPYVVASIALTGQTANIPLTSLFTPTATGVYRVAIYAVSTAGTGIDTIPVLNVFWTDDFGTEDLTTSSYGAINISINAATGEYQPKTLSPYIIENVAGQPIQYSVTGGTYSTLIYSLYLVVERLS